MVSAKRILPKFLALAPVFWTAPALAEEAKSPIGYASVAEALEALRSDPTATESTQQGWILFVRAQGLEFWSFTPESHPAHPSAAKRTAHKDLKGGWAVETRLLCQADKASCDALAEDYRQLDARMKANIRKRHGS
ncbi:MAG: hypothetical protein RH942_17025 [Kiloniellaceae bacterium]